TWFPKGQFETLVLFLDPLLFSHVALDHDPAQFELVEQLAVEDGLVYHMGVAIAQEMQSDGLAGSLYVESLTHTLAVHLLRHYTVFPSSPPRLSGQLAPATLKQVQDYIEANLHGPLTLAEIAGVAHLSPYHFARLFKRTTGQTVHQFVLHRRLLMGRRLLEAGELTIAEIADSLGFADASHFGRHFKQYVGVTPGQIQKLRR
ncbi:partial HTH-type transcriptional activator Btr, partial [Anaerolineae bacterium]